MPTRVNKPGHHHEILFFPHGAIADTLLEESGALGSAAHWVATTNAVIGGTNILTLNVRAAGSGFSGCGSRSKPAVFTKPSAPRGWCCRLG